MKRNFILLITFFIFLNLFSQNAGKALYFDGIDDYVDCGNDTSLQITDEITIEVWVRYDEVEDNWSRIVTKGNWDGRHNGWMLYFSDNPDATHTGVIFSMEINGTDQSISTNNTEIIEGKWYHITGSFNGNTMKLYINGSLKASKDYSGTLTENNGPYNVQIGRSYHWEEYLHGAVDEVRIWDIALPDSTINNWMHHSITTSHPFWNNLQGYWKFDDENDPTNDYSQNNNSGDLVNGPIFIDSDVVLPIILSHFSINYQNENLQIRWQTSSENNLLGWNIYRGDNENAINYNAIKINLHIIQANGTNSYYCDYSYYDPYILSPDKTYWYWLEAIDYSGNSQFFGPTFIKINSTDNNPTTNTYQLKTYNYPNPFSSNTLIYFSESKKFNPDIEIPIFNLKGQIIKKLKPQKAGEHGFITFWDGCDNNGKRVKNGIYFYKIPNSKKLIKMILNK